MRARGFTLMELMVVLAIMGTIAVAATPALSRWSANLRMDSATNELASTLQLARIKAISQNASIRVEFDTATHTYQMQQRDTVDPTRWSNVESTKKLPVAVQLVSVTSNPVIFQSGRGSTVPGSNTTVTLQNTQGKKADVVVAQTGRVSVRKY
ncbi:MAG: type II secretion system protein GspH [Candidatus Tectomicrobia bacterium]|uniref:Type II secretion system protein H n=1 Tax=Tectimicrobiota bacterium TaxID=2528274 RepID=A0A937VZB3_UNCTE|nr:type II secretion system protein GspH [Candidatus Tectomicrobia bacterium]